MSDRHGSSAVSDPATRIALTSYRFIPSLSLSHITCNLARHTRRRIEMNQEETASSSVSVVEKVLLESELEAERSDGANEGDTTWVQRREKLVTQALEDENYEALKRIAALPGGFGTEELRQQAWCVTKV